MPNKPKNIEQAIEWLNNHTSNLEKEYIAFLNEEQLNCLLPTLGKYIKNNFGLWNYSSDIMRYALFKHKSIAPDDVVLIILKFFWKDARKKIQIE